MKTEWMCALMLAASPVFAASEAVNPKPTEEIIPGKPGQITLSWAEFQKLYDELRQLKGKPPQPPVLPPVDFVLSRARYTGKVEGGVLEMSAVMDLNVLKNKAWVEVPFLPASVALKEALLDGQPTAVMSSGGNHAIVTNLPGRHTLQIRFSLPYPKKEEVPAIKLSLPQTAMTLLELELPQPGLDVQVTPSQGTRIQTVQGHTRIVAALPPTQFVQLQWQKALPPEQHLPAKLYVETQELIHISENAMGISSRFQYSILHSAVPSVRMSIPEGLNVLSVRAESLREWKVAQEKGKNILTVYFTYPRRQAVEVAVESEIASKDSVTQIPRIIALDVEREQGAIGVDATGVIELKTELAKGLQPIDVKELPAPMWQAAKNPLLMGFRYLQQPYNLALNIQRHEEVSVLTTAVDSANAVTLFVKEGLAVTHASYQVRNHLKQFMAFELPEDSEIWSAFVNGQPVKPAKDKAGKILIPLAKSMDQDGNSEFPVEIIYCTKMPGFHLMGYKSAFLPAPDVPVSQMMWSVYLPSQFRFPKFWGDMERESSPIGLGSMIGGTEAYLKDADNLRDDKRREIKSKAMRA